MKTLQELVDRGLEIEAELAALGREKKGIEEQIKTIAQARSDEHVPLKDDDREGRKFLARGRLVVPVIFTADKLIGSFQQSSKEHARIGAALPDDQFEALFPEFFKPWSGFENRFDDGQKFRERAAALLGSEAPAFIVACLARDKNGLPKSDVKIEWKQATADLAKEAA